MYAAQLSTYRHNFLNPDILEKEHWKCGHVGPLTVNNVLNWANVHKICNAYYTLYLLLILWPTAN